VLTSPFDVIHQAQPGRQHEGIDTASNGEPKGNEKFIESLRGNERVWKINPVKRQEFHTPFIEFSMLYLRTFSV